jgi:hypothetical protein
MTWRRRPRTLRDVASEDEIRRVAEEIRALARSLARDFRDAVEQSRAGGSAAGEAVRHGLKGVAEEARRGVQGSFSGYPPRYGRPGQRHRSRDRWARDRWARDQWAGHWCPPGPPDGTPWQGGPPPTGAPGGRYFRPPYQPSHPHPRPHQRHGGSRRRGLPPVRHRWDATTVIGALAVVFGVAWLLDAVHAAHISVEGAVAVGLMVLGAAMIVTGRTDWSLSRRSWPVFAGAALILVLVATSNTFGAGAGSSGLSFGNENVASVQPGQTIRGGFGNLTVNASNLTAGQKVTIQNIAGDVRVTLPAGPPARINARVLAGVICVNGRDVGNGMGASVSQTLAGTAAGPPVVVDVHEASGQIIVGPGGCAR